MVVYAVVRARQLAVLPGALGGIGVLVLVFVLVRGVEEALPWPVVFLGAAYTASLVTRGHGVDEGVPLVAAGLLLCVELAAWSLDERLAIAAEHSVFRGRVLAVASLTGAGLVAAATVVALAAVSTGGGLGWTVLGSVAAVLAVGTAARLGRR